VDWDVQPWRSHSRGGGVFSTNLPTFTALETSNPRDNLQLTSALLKGEEDLSGELFRSTLAFPLEGGGVLFEPTFILLKTSNARKTSS